ncbi:MAG: hypothetical protein KatS3mg076_1640 [Candidatus Binatia bacterium]|nr:MAG: hypothetical protein KatS3mg076_1640 [Candidatus Binatia bacterium]
MESQTNRETTAERHVPRLVEPEVLLPSQYYELIAGHHFLEGEKRLMLAIMEDAISCYQKYAGAKSGRAHRIFQEAEEWIFDRENSGWVFSFESICQALGIEAEFLRKGLVRWREQHLRPDGTPLVKFSRVRLRAARRHKIVPLRERKRRKPVAQAA